MMRGQQMHAAMLAAPAGEQPVAAGASRLLDSGRRFFLVPDEDLVPDRTRRQPAGEPPDLGAAFRPQAVIDGQRADLAAARPRPAVGQDRQRQAVRTARHADRHERRALEGGEPVERGGELGETQRLRRRLRVQHPSRFFSCAERSLMALPGCGNSWSSCISAMHALCFWLARASDMPSFKRPSAAFGPLG